MSGVHRGPGLALVTGAAGGIVLVAFAGRVRLPRAVVAALLAVLGALLAAGGAYVEGEGGPAQAVAAAVALAVLTPLHVRALLGPLGRSHPAGAG